MRSFSDMWYDPVARKKILIFGGGGLAFIIILIIIIVVATSGSKKENFRGRWVLDSVPLVDGHNDLAYNIFLLEQNKLEEFDFKYLSNNTHWTNVNNTYHSNTDLTRLAEGKVHGQFWSAYVDCNTTDHVARTLEQIDVIKRLIAKYSDDMELVTEHDGIMQAFWNTNKKIASLIGVEGGHSIGSSLAVLRLYYDLGVRYMTLTHDCNTPWAESSADQTATVHGLTEFGKAVVLEMNRLGMMVDISHVSKLTMLDVLETSKTPVIFSHSSSAAKTNIIGNVDDEVLVKLKNNTGIIMVNFGSNFVKTSAEENANVTIDDVIAHLDHIKEITGSSKFVGIGANFDGLTSLPYGLEDVSKYPDLFDKLYDSSPNRTTSWNEEDLKNLASGNIIRVMGAVEKYRDDNKIKLQPDDNSTVPAV